MDLLTPKVLMVRGECVHTFFEFLFLEAKRDWIGLSQFNTLSIEGYAEMKIYTQRHSHFCCAMVGA
jgi:hypothetical protein